MASAAVQRDELLERFRRTRALTLDLIAPLSDADATAQSMPDASPAKWHLAHTTWFLETFILRELGVPPFDPRWAYLFNSYYEAEGPRHARPGRGLLTRPSLRDVKTYRAHVDGMIEQYWERLDAELRARVELGCEHEAQHQELLLTDILHLFAQNPLAPALWPAQPVEVMKARPLAWVEGPIGVIEVGHDGPGFAFDCEGPRHRVFLEPYALADRLVTNGEWDAFVADGGYRRADLWLSDGWAWVRAEEADGPLHWRENGLCFGLAGLQRRDPAEPVTHISQYEADAYARWGGARLPTEFEWEAVAERYGATGGNQLDTAGPVRPHAARAGDHQFFGDAWEWTSSAFLPYPGYQPAGGALGEYNGKFMSGQAVLRGGSCATPRGTMRATTRNFFPPTMRWQFSGVRLAKSL